MGNSLYGLIIAWFYLEVNGGKPNSGLGENSSENFFEIAFLLVDRDFFVGAAERDPWRWWEFFCGVGVF